MTAIDTLKLYEEKLSPDEELSTEYFLKLGWLNNQRPSSFRWEL